MINIAKIAYEINKYYPHAKKLIVCVNSEYDDSGYDNEIVSYYVLDSNGNEIGLSKNFLNKREYIKSLLKEEIYIDNYTSEYQNDIVLSLE